MISDVLILKRKQVMPLFLSIVHTRAPADAAIMGAGMRPCTSIVPWALMGGDLGQRVAIL